MSNNMIQNAAAQSGITATTKKPKSMQDYIKVMEPAIKAALPSVITPERFTRITLSALSSNPKLAECTPQSFLGAMMSAAQLGVEPNTVLGQAYLIPFRNRGQMECQFQLGYKGLIDLAFRSGEVTDISAETVYQNDEFHYELGLNPKLEHKPAMADRGDPVAFYAVFHTKSGGFGFKVMSIDDVRNHAKKFSKSYSNGPWQTNFEEMAKKTVMKAVLKYAPLKSDFVRGIAQDETIKTEINEDMTSIADVTEYEVVDAIDVDTSTGEVIENG